MQSFNFSKKLKNQLMLAVNHTLKVNELALLHHELGRYYASCYKKLDAQFKTAKLIGLHGQTVFHKGAVATLQIGEASYLSALAGVAVVSDFRVADIACGGQGAPLATYFHNKIFSSYNKTISIHNLGGISNLSLLKNEKLIQGFDTGPANMLIDMAIQKATMGKKLFDKNGILASKGIVNAVLVKKMLKHSFFKLPPPKSCGREEFGEVFYNKYNAELFKLSLNDRLATLTDFVATSISNAYLKHCKLLPSEIIFCGGGALNEFLLKKISEKLPQIIIKTSLNYNWPVQSIEGAAFAYLAAAKMFGEYSNIPSSTGAYKKTSLGKITQV